MKTKEKDYNTKKILGLPERIRKATEEMELIKEEMKEEGMVIDDKGCNHEWKHVEIEGWSMDRRKGLWLVHKCEKCGIQACEGRIRLFEKKPKHL